MYSELYHHGIPGMKWGVRRYQNKDGSLTAAGRRRLGLKSVSDKAATIKVKKKKTVKPVEEVKKPSVKTVRDMTDQEIRDAIARKRLENEYLTLHPAPVKKDGVFKQYLSSVASKGANAAADVTVNLGKQYVQKMLEKKLGLTTEKPKSTLEKLKEQYDELDYQRKIKDLQNHDKKDDEYAKLKKEYDIKKIKNDIKNIGVKDEEFEKLSRESKMATMQTIVDRYNTEHIDDREYELWLKTHANKK